MRFILIIAILLVSTILIAADTLDESNRPFLFSVFAFSFVFTVYKSVKALKKEREEESHKNN